MDNLAPLVEFRSLASVVKTTERVNLTGWTERRLDGEASRDGGTPIQSNQRELLYICLWSGLMTHHCGFHELFELRCMRCDVGKTNKQKNVHIGWFMDSLKWDVFWQWFCACVCVSVCVCVHKCIYLQSNACMNMRDHQYRYRFCSNCLVLPLQPETTPAMFLGLCWLLLSPHRDGFNRVAFREQINLILNMLLTTKNTKHWKKNTRPCLIKKK